MFFAPTRRIRFAIAPAALLIVFAPLALAQQPAASKGPTKQMTPADLKAWKSIRQSVLSNDGKWFVYVLAPNEGDASLVVRSTGTDAKETGIRLATPARVPVVPRRRLAGVAVVCRSAVTRAGSRTPSRRRPPRARAVVVAGQDVAEHRRVARPHRLRRPRTKWVC
jgi:hypothetical protein